MNTGDTVERYAVISDVHSNQEALTRVFEDIDARGIETVFCLGDIIGYGPDPEFCVDLIRARCARVIRGNHDDALFNSADRFNVFAKEALLYSRDRLRPRFLRRGQTAERWDWLRKLPEKFRHGDALFVHGSPNDPVNEYVYQEDIYFNANTKLKSIFEQTTWATFCGHTHYPVVINSELGTFTPSDETPSIDLPPSCKYIVNVGSVGQPRDHDNRSCYVEVEGTTVHYHRVAYDFNKTAAKINKISRLDELLGTRLAKGR